MTLTSSAICPMAMRERAEMRFSGLVSVRVSLRVSFLVKVGVNFMTLLLARGSRGL